LEEYTEVTGKIEMKDCIFFSFWLGVGVALSLTGCGDDATDEVDCASSGPRITISSFSNPNCQQGGTVNATSASGNSPIYYSINGVDFQTTGVFEGLGSGTHTVTAKDAYDCTATTSVVLTLENDLEFSYTATNAGCGGSDGSLEISALGGTGDYRYSLDGSGFQAWPAFTNLSDGIHVVEVEDGLCILESEVVVPSGISYMESVAPIVTERCAIPGCHAGGQEPDMREFANIQESAETIKSRVVSRSMPPAQLNIVPLTDDEIQTIACWVTDGALEN